MCENFTSQNLFQGNAPLSLLIALHCNGIAMQNWIHDHEMKGMHKRFNIFTKSPITINVNNTIRQDIRLMNEHSNFKCVLVLRCNNYDSAIQYLHLSKILLKDCFNIQANQKNHKNYFISNTFRFQFNLQFTIDILLN